MELMMNGVEIKNPDRNNQVCFESTNDNKRHADMRYLPKRGNEKDFIEDILVPGEFAEIVDKHTLAFCFGKGDVSYLNLDETISEETAKELIFRIKQFIEYSYNVERNRLGYGNGK